MTNEKRYRDLKYLMDYFHQDWKCDFNSDSDLLLHFASENPAATVEGAIKDIGKFMADNTDARKVDDILVKEWHAGPPYRPSSLAIKWLKHVERVLKQSKSACEKSNLRTSIPINSSIGKYPGLYLLMCQFDDCWKEVFKTETNVLKHFRKAASREDVEACVGDIVTILGENHSDKDLNRILKKDLKGYPPFKAAHQARAWLEHVRVVYRNLQHGV
jgi:hypothetical protein